MEQEKIQLLLRERSERDAVIQLQAKRIRTLESELESVKRERNGLLQKLNGLHVEKGCSEVVKKDGGEDGVRVLHPLLTERAKTFTGLSLTNTPKTPTKFQRQASVTSSLRIGRQHSFKKVKEAGKGKGRQLSPSVYELSQDIRDKQTEVLEKKYGGSVRARHAARVIQRAFRQYSMNRNFERLRSVKRDRRHMVRLGNMGRQDSVWEEVRITQNGRLIDPQSSPNLRAYSSSKHKKVSSHGKENHKNNHMKSKQVSVGHSRTDKLDRLQQSLRAAELGILDPNELNNNRNIDVNDGSAESGGSFESFVDLPSINFENLLENKDVDLSDSFQSDTASLSSMRSGSSIGGHYHRTSDVLYDSANASQWSEYSEHIIPRSNSDGAVQPIHSTQLTSLPSPIDHDRHDTRPMYPQTEVKLRTKKQSSQASPIWKRKSAIVEEKILTEDAKRMSNISETSEPDSVTDSKCYSTSSSSDVTSMTSSESNQQLNSYHHDVPAPMTSQKLVPKINDRDRKRQYRIGLNLFNKKPEKGIRYLMEKRFIENSSRHVAKFLIQRKGLSKQMIGEYLGNLQSQFNMDVLEFFVDEIDLSGLQIDVALRKFQTYFRMPGEAQKIERLMEAFAHRYCLCNPDQIKKFVNPDTVFLLAFAIIMLNTDLHSPNVKNERKMKLADFIKNLRGIDEGEDVDQDLLKGIYDRVLQQAFIAGTDHLTQVMKVEQSIVGKKPQLCLSQRRLVCYCRLYEISDPMKKEKAGSHQREVFLFNDILVVTKIFSKKKTGVTYSFRRSIPLGGTQAYQFETAQNQFGLRLISSIDSKPLITFNGRNDHDRNKFVDDLREAILEMNEMEAMRIDDELAKQHSHCQVRDYNRNSNDSGMVDYDLLRPSDPSTNRMSAPLNQGHGGPLTKSALSGSLDDLLNERGPVRTDSRGSVDSGMVSSSRGSVDSGMVSSNSSSNMTSTSSSTLQSGSNHTSGGPQLKTASSPNTLHPSKSSNGFKSLFGGRKSKSSKSSPQLKAMEKSSEC